MILLVERHRRAQGQPEAQRVGHRARSQARQGPRPGGDGARAGRHAQRRRHVHRRPDRRPRARADRRPRQADQVGRAVDAGRSARPRRVCRSRATSSRWPTPPRRGRSRRSARSRRRTAALGAKGGRLTLESLQAQIAEGGMKELPIIIKADVQGSAEVLADTLAKLTDEKVKIRIIHSGVGAVNESDVLLGVGVERDHHRVQRAARSQRRGDRGARARRHPPALGHLQRHRRDEEGDDRACSSRPSRKSGSASPKSATSSRCRSSARSPAAWSPKAASRAPATRRRGCCATTSWSTKARSARCAGSRTMSSEVKAGLRVRHRLRQVQRPQGRRRHRSVRDGARR